jgi:lipopolysaccharide transport system ATP-binding protein
MGEIAVKVEDVSKKYCRSLRRSMYYGIRDATRNIFGLGTDSENLRKDEFWALDNVSFELKRGEALGIIGPNGSGKTTLLKMLNGIFWPDKGKIAIKGKVGALIELATGFHPALTGRENIYINGAILGMGRRAIDKAFAAIVDFADIGDSLDSPVGHYSSGMLARLGFAVAIHCQPDILLIDEILAVGDIAFRAKCYSMITGMLRNCIVIIVSHDMPAISRISTRCIYIDNGHLIFQGTPRETIQHYLSSFQFERGQVYSRGVNVKEITVAGQDTSGNNYYNVSTDEPLEITLGIESEVAMEPVRLRLCFLSASSEFAGEWNSWFNGYPLRLKVGYQKFSILLDPLRLNPGIYGLSLIISSVNELDKILWVHNGWFFQIYGRWFSDAPYQIKGSLL